MRFVRPVAGSSREPLRRALFTFTCTKMAGRPPTSAPPPFEFGPDIEPSPTWFYHDGRQQFGPITADALFVLASSGLVSPTDKVWTQGLGGWIEARRVTDLVFKTPNEDSFPGTT